MFGDEIERLQHFDPLTGELILDDLEHVAIWPATHYNVKEGSIEAAVAEIGEELNQRCAELEAEGKLLESHRLRQRTQYDMEMLREVGFCSGIENYSRILDGRPPGARPYCLIDYFPDDFVCFLDESHQTTPQIGGMYHGDRSRKQTLVDYGFRLPSAMDNRPQTFDEFLSITPQIVFVSATPGEYERTRSARVVEQIVRPTGSSTRRGRARDAQPDRRPDERDPRRRRPRRARPGHDAHQEDERGPDGLPARDGLQGPLPALGGRHARADPDHPRPAPRRVRRPGRREPAARGPRPARGLARGDPRRRQGGLPARGDLAHPDDRPRRRATSTAG
jgi:excinuclease ABC subunit B